MRRFLAILVFALAAGAASAAGSGIVVAPHIEPPGVPLFHTHVLAAYRLPIFLDVLRARLDPSQGIFAPQRMLDLEATFALALLVFAWPRLPRPALLAVGEVAPARLARALWRSPHILGPPRALLRSA
jgi:hypothetical protein